MKVTEENEEALSFWDKVLCAIGLHSWYCGYFLNWKRYERHCLRCWKKQYLDHTHKKVIWVDFERGGPGGPGFGVVREIAHKEP